MTEEDFTAAKLKGYNVCVKFIDGETLFFKVSDIKDNWFSRVERFINASEDIGPDYDECCPIGDIAFNRAHIKYIKQL